MNNEAHATRVRQRKVRYAVIANGAIYLTIPEKVRINDYPASDRNNKK